MSLPIHPAIVHFPIALMITAALMIILSFIIGRHKMQNGILWVLIIGLISGVIAIVTGLGAKTAHAGELSDAARQLIETHETNAYFIEAVYLIVTLWLLFRRNKMPMGEYLIWFIIVLVGCGLIFYQGYLGGELVFEHGIGVQTDNGHQH